MKETCSLGWPQRTAAQKDAETITTVGHKKSLGYIGTVRGGQRLQRVHGRVKDGV